MLDQKLLRVRLDRAAYSASGTRLRRTFRHPWRLLTAAALVRLGKRSSWTVAIEAPTFFGRTMKVRLPEDVSMHIFRYGFHEYGLSAMLLDYLEPQGVFVDVGAHFGYFTALASSVVGSDGEVHSFEPTPRTFQTLLENAHRCSENVRTVQAAVGSGSSRTATINDLGFRLSAFNSTTTPRLTDRFAPEVNVIEVPCVSLDEYFRAQPRLPTFVKIDAESSEMEVLKGMTGLMSESAPIISVEVGDFEISGVLPSLKIVEYLDTLGYQAMEFSRGRIRPHVPSEHYGYDNLLFIHANRGVRLPR